ncbi:MAG: hypothetical protein CMG71_03720 [Candidatus Marinimicrobia bacterium]|nr:hypothetical protein [Candidatus Neomarinimicrobiota bacterium]|tara:strand:- start:3251 stop:3916 length:666 start_codon:yes stop_codon:yes gene_type:complete
MLPNTISLIAAITFTFSVAAGENDWESTICRVKYSGGGDWYSDPSSLSNLLEFLNEQTSVSISSVEARVSLDDDAIFSYPFLYLTGHGNVRFSEIEIENLRRHLSSGGFLHADDNYGLDKSFRREMKRVFPEKDWVELPFDHPIYSSFFKITGGLPKIHEHDNKPPQGLGLFEGDRLIVFYSYESDLGDGWEGRSVHNNPEEKRISALQMGANIFIYSLIQ